MSESGEEKRKIIIDEDWKSQVEKERENLKQTPPSASEDTSEPEPEASMPPASFQFLITSLASQALMCLGQIPDPFENKTVVRVDVARHYIDLLEVLEEKTRGNLTEEENGELQGILHQLRMLYVMVQQSGK